MAATALDRVVLVTRDLAALAEFYEAALGLRREAPAGLAPGELLLGLEKTTATSIRLRAVAQVVELVQYEPAGQPCSEPPPGNSTHFQHFALVVSDMEAAVARLRTQAGWRPITRNGPQRLPPENGGVLAFKFLDPEGHPLEFLQFPPGHERWSEVSGTDPLLGIDHTAISVADVECSRRFYVDGLGLHLGEHSLNKGTAQEQLDDLSRPMLDVVGLNFTRGAPPHLELLGYQVPTVPIAESLNVNDVLSTRTVMWCSNVSDALHNSGAQLIEAPLPKVAGRETAALVRDPDGHLLLLLQQSSSSS